MAMAIFFYTTHMGQELVQLLITPDRQQNMPWNNPKLVVIFSSVSGQLEHLVAD
jgi:hypothetical protein